MVVSITGLAQDPQFSQFYSNPLYLAPSFAGAVEGSRVAASYRNQWFHLPVSFVTYSFSYDHYFSGYNSGVGLFLLKDAAGSGELGTMNAGLQYSYNFKLFHTWQIRPGLHFYYIEHGLSYDKLKFIDQTMNAPPIDEGYPSVIDKVRDVDLATSLLIYSKKFWIGANIDHLLSPNISLFADEHKVPLRVNVFGGVEIRRKGRLLNPIDETMTLAYMFRSQGTNTQLDIGVYWHRNPLVLGLWYRGIPPMNSQRGDAFIILVGYKTPYFNIGYSYDVTVSNLITHAIGSHEVTMSFKFLIPRRSKLGALPCPDF
ncbi:MAG: PorP/SprF family type IX secretion system membrane protein [Bacteroidales bacterium]|nr:PorP/SprF family type IX secretion system membrane protein [Bacteroidales bacterium]